MNVLRHPYMWVYCNTYIHFVLTYCCSEKFEETLAALKNISHLSVYRKEDLPERYHYSHSDRIQPIVVEADVGWNICGNKTKSCTLGMHLSMCFYVYTMHWVWQQTDFDVLFQVCTATTTNWRRCIPYLLVMVRCSSKTSSVHSFVSSTFTKWCVIFLTSHRLSITVALRMSNKFSLLSMVRSIQATATHSVSWMCR